ncbi:MAG: HlyD family efflux transporter periplasmic adaptor subunit, partial [Armatimonadetes bacterium]|nr:HlyD family efflux transporter periplasmic adaptor subunit [Armatimonadota bacterium]
MRTPWATLSTGGRTVKRILWLAGVGAVVALGAWIGRGGIALPRKPTPPGRSELVSRGDIEIKVVETGAIEPLRKVEVKSRVAGRIERLLVREGDRVQAGQRLLEIDPTEINSQVEQIRAQLEGARARLDQAGRATEFQTAETTSRIREAQQALASAEARLKVSEAESAAQPSLTEGEIQQAEATLRSVEGNLTLLSSSTHPQALVQAASALREVAAAEQASRLNLQRQRRLFGQGFSSRREAEAAEAEYAGARARLEQARTRQQVIAEQNRIELANAASRVAEARAARDRALAGRAQVGIRTQQLEAARAAVEQARAQGALAQAGRTQDRMREDSRAEARAAVRQLEQQLREVQVRQRDTHLDAPMSGTVTRRYVEAGELVTSGVSSFSAGTPVLQIADLSRMLVRISINEVDVHQVRPGLPVEIELDGVRGEKFQGRVERVAPAAQAAGAAQSGAEGSSGSAGASSTGGVVRYAVEVLLSAADRRVRPGMSARCSIIVDRRRDVLRLPLVCLATAADEETVRVVTANRQSGALVEAESPR